MRKVFQCAQLGDAELADRYQVLFVVLNACLDPHKGLVQIAEEIKIEAESIVEIPLIHISRDISSIAKVISCQHVSDQHLLEVGQHVREHLHSIRWHARNTTSLVIECCALLLHLVLCLL